MEARRADWVDPDNHVAGIWRKPTDDIIAKNLKKDPKDGLFIVAHSGTMTPAESHLSAQYRGSVRANPSIDFLARKFEAKLDNAIKRAADMGMPVRVPFTCNVIAAKDKQVLSEPSLGRQQYIVPMTAEQVSELPGLQPINTRVVVRKAMAAHA